MTARDENARLELQEEVLAAAQLEEHMRALQELARDFSGSLNKGLQSAIFQGKDLQSIFQQIARDLSRQTLQAALKPLSGALADGLGAAIGSFGASNGGVGSSLEGASGATAFADGGILTAPSYFRLPQGLGVAGEAGPEAVLPLQRTADGRLGVAAASGVSAAPINITIQTPDPAGFRHSSAQIAQMVARAAGRGRRGL
ncbi:phage tail tape measure protein [Polycladidibacter hongkongensis]|uniref:phage tail tape measure protein n=1 Tax=Polycladidibacter hongkongensis TaxID=1647556 RepID=UPI00083391A2|nr:phage tail tape measure protein [Pseudovibrio hongkongensis]